MHEHMYGSCICKQCLAQTVRIKIRDDERRRLSQLFTTKGRTDWLLVQLFWPHFICFGPTSLDPLVQQRRVVGLAVSSSGPRGSVVASAGPAHPRGPQVQQDDRNDLRRNRRSQCLQSAPYGGSNHSDCQTALPLSRPHLHSGHRK